MRFRSWCVAAVLLACLGTSRAQDVLDAVVPILEMPVEDGAVVEEESVLVDVGQPDDSPQPGLEVEPADDAEPYASAFTTCLENCTEIASGGTPFLVVDSVFLQRDNATNNQPIAVHPVRGGANTVLTSRRLRYDTAPGVRLLYGARGKDGLGWEAGYLGVYGMFADADVVDPNGISVPGALGSNVPGFGSAQRLRPKYFSTLNVAEVNALLSESSRHGDLSARLPWDRCPHERTTDLIGGFFWAGLGESASLGITPPGAASTAYSVATTSNLFGAQLGMRRRTEWERFALEGTFKAGVAGSFLSASADAITTPLVPGNVYRGSRSLRTTSAGLLSTITITAIYRLNDTWGLRAGYDMAWLSGLALAPNQWDFTDTPTSGTTLYGAGGLFLQGASLGLESRW
jgi:hypothetical protein